MTAKTKAVRSAVAAHSATVRHRGTDSLAAVETLRELRAAILQEHVEHILATAPPLTAAQRAKIAALLVPGGGPG